MSRDDETDKAPSPKTGPAAHPYADLLGLQLDELESGRSTCSLEVTERLYNPQRVAHGAVLYALADTGMGAALYPTLAQGEICATVEIKINYYRPVRAGLIRCVTELVYRGKRVANLESSLYAEERLVAKANGSYSIFEVSGKKPTAP